MSGELTADDEINNDLFNKHIQEKGEPEGEIEEQEDGSAKITFNDDTAKSVSPEFYANLADSFIPELELGSIGIELLELVEQDIEDRSERDIKYAEGLRRTGLGDEAPGGATFKGASKVVHPLMLEACIDFSAKVMMELMPRGGGPVKDKIPGNITREKVDKAKRKSRYMNYQLTEVIPEFRVEMEQGMTQVPLGGAHYVKLYWDGGQRRPRPAHIDIDDMILPYAANSYLGAERMTHRQTLTKFTFDKRVRDGMYRDIKDIVAIAPDKTQAKTATDKIQGATDNGMNIDKERIVYEIYIHWDVEPDVGVAPYIITVDKNSQSVLSVYRNWKETDVTMAALPHIVEFPFVPFRGAYPIGLPHMIGGLSSAATGSLRALLDSAMISNSQAAVKLKGGTRGGQNLNIAPTEIKEIEGAGVSTDPDIRKVMMPLPFPPPSNVLLQLLGFVVEAGKGVVRTTFEDIPDQTTQMPVGTTLALIEQGMTVFSAIHARLHDSMGQLLKILHRLNEENLTDHQIYDQMGELAVKREDFEGPMDVVPVSDPNIFSQVQRASQTALIAQRQQAVPALYDPRAVEERILEDAKIPDPKSLLIPKKEPKSLNALNENLAAARAQPIAAFPDQDHLAHLQTHLDFLKSPFLGMNPLIAPKFLPIMLEHLTEHITLFYAKTMYDKISEALGEDASELMTKNDSEMDAEFEQLIAMASQLLLPDVEAAFQAVPPIIQQAMQIMQSYQPPQPMDPAQAQLQIAGMNKETKTQELQLKGQEIQQRGQEKAATEQSKIAATQLQTDTTKQVAQMREQGEMHRATQAEQAKRDMNREDNMTALVIVDKELEHDAKTNLSTGTGINPGS